MTNLERIIISILKSYLYKLIEYEAILSRGLYFHDLIWFDLCKKNLPFLISTQRKEVYHKRNVSI